jgi:hypothetical protein
MSIGVGLQEASPELGPDLSSEGTIELMKTWHTNCLSCHDQCSRGLGNAIKFQLPTRLLDVGCSGSQTCRLRLTSSESLGSISEGYLTLSHRWNESKFLTLNSSSMDRLLKGIPISTLPRCFQDTVSLAHIFRIRYLWIDSICIKQDSEEDWLEEAPKMKDVYGGAVINIVAGHSTGPEDSVFHTEDRPFAQSVVIRSEWIDEDPTDHVIWNHANVKQDFEKAPLTRRGWVFQERMLAPRILQFGKTQVYWSCSALFACESLPHGALSPEGEAVTYGTNLKELKPLVSGALPLPGPDDLADLWFCVVLGYSGCELTFSRDKLVALSGVAQLFRQVTGDRYLAGLWRSSMTVFLCWRRLNSDGNPAKPRPEYCAPTWSWASIDGQVDLLANERAYDNTFWFQELVEVVDAHVTPLHGDSTASVKDGFIRVRGKLYSFLILSNGDKGVLCKVDGETRAGDDKFTADIALENPEEMELWILPILVRAVSSHFVGHFLLEGLVLTRSEDSAVTSRNGGTYKRVGHFQSKNYLERLEDKVFGINAYQEESAEEISDEEYDEDEAGEEEADEDGVDEEESDWNDYEDVSTEGSIRLRRRVGACPEIKIV